MIQRTTYLLIAALQTSVACLCLAVPVHAQDRNGLPAFTGLAAGIELVRGSAWSFQEEIPELGQLQPHDIRASTGLAAHLSYAVTPYAGPFVAASLSLYGTEPSGITTYEGGVELRVPKAAARVLPFAQVSLGRLHWSGGLRYTYAGVGAGAELFLSERFAIRLGARGTWPVADGRRDIGPDEAPLYLTARLGDAAQIRLSAGMCWHFSRRR